MQDHRELKVWQKAHAFTLAVYRETQQWPKEEMFGLTSQVRRAAVSIAANIAEGCGRSGNAEFIHFVNIANGSAAELDAELLLAHDLGYLPEHNYAELLRHLTELRRMLNAFHQRLKTNNQRPERSE